MPPKTKSTNKVEKEFQKLTKQTTSKSPLAKKRAITELSAANISNKLD